MKKVIDQISGPSSEVAAFKARYKDLEDLAKAIVARYEQGRKTITKALYEKAAEL